MNDRLEELEIKVAFQENTIAELDAVVRALGDEIEQMKRRMRELQEEHAASLESPPHEKPPHY